MGTLRICEEGFGRSKPQESAILLDDLYQRLTYAVIHPESKEEFYRTESYPASHYTGEGVAIWQESYQIGFKR